MGQPSKEAIAYLQEQFALAESEESGLKSTIATLQAKQEGIQLKIKALRTALTEAGVSVPTGDASPAPSRAAGKHAPNVPIPPGTGIRAAVRMVLKDAPNGYRPRDLVNELQKRGYSFNGKVEPATRLSTELWRMAKTGQVEKRGAEYFAARREDDLLS